MGFFARRYTSIDVPTAQALIADGASLVDVRSEKEWVAGHVDGAIHIPLNELSERMGELPVGTAVVTVCHTGLRSAIAARKLGASGYSVSNIRGGMIAWDRATK